MLTIRFATILLLTGVASVSAQTQSSAAATAKAKAIELAKFDSVDTYRAKTGPAGGEWDSQYRSLFQPNAEAVSKGLPAHADAIADIKADAARSKENLQKHKGWALYIMWGSRSYRGAEGTAALKTLYTSLVDMEFGGRGNIPLQPPPAGSAAAGGGGNNTPTRQPARQAATSVNTARPNTPPPTVTRPGAGYPVNRPAVVAFEDEKRVDIDRDVVYGRADFAAQRMDVYRVHATKPTPVLVEFHGGGWRNGGRNQFDLYPGDLFSKAIDAGISIISVEYRMTPEYTMPAMTDDAARAIQFIRSKATAWNIDPARIIAIGGSAGAHLSAWVALHDDLADPASTDAVARQSSRLTAFVDLWGPMDLTRPNPAQMSSINVRGEDFAKAFTAVCGCTAEEFTTDSLAKKRMRAASPLFYVSKDDPPALIVHQGPVVTDKNHPAIPATINDPHSWQHGALLADAMENAGIKVMRYISPTAGKDPAKDVPMILGFIKSIFDVR